jgi:hypothetical protein
MKRTSREGMAFITVLVLAAIALAFTAVMLYLITSGTKITGIETRYTSSLEVAKGVSNYIMRLMNEGKTDFCSKYTTDNCRNAESGVKEEIDLSKDNYDEFWDYKAKAYLLSVIDDKGATIYAVEVEVFNQHTRSEKVIVDFVYRVEP